MAYDSTDFVVTALPLIERDPKSITDPRERVAYLRDFLRALPIDSPHYCYSNWRTSISCGTALCIGGWTAELFLSRPSMWSVGLARDALGLTEDQGDYLFFNPEGMRSTTAQAANVLDHYLATGKIDWSVA